MTERLLEIHLLYASIVWLAAWLLTSQPRGSATLKYWIWVATSLNFVVPVTLFPYRLAVTPEIPNGALSAGRFPTSITVIWSIGAAVMLVRLSLRLVADARAKGHGPAVHGLLRPHIHLPNGIDRLLTADELDAVLLHERRHADRRDNLIRLLHELSLCILWFHPFVWMTRSRLALYRELSCDEAVTRRSRGDHLVSALAKLAESGDAVLLQATASSFIGDRLARLASPQSSRATNAIVGFLFCLTLVAAAPSTQCPHAVDVGRALSPPTGGITGGVTGGIKGGIAGGIAGGIKGGVTGGVHGGIR